MTPQVRKLVCAFYKAKINDFPLRLSLFWEIGKNE